MAFAKFQHFHVYRIRFAVSKGPYHLTSLQYFPIVSTASTFVHAAQFNTLYLVFFNCNIANLINNE